MIPKVKTKKVKISSKGQITLPKSFLDEIGVAAGEELLLKFLDGKIEITNQKQIFKNKLKNFKPIFLGINKKVNFSETHNDIYD